MCCRVRPCEIIQMPSTCRHLRETDSVKRRETSGFARKVRVSLSKMCYRWPDCACELEHKKEQRVAHTSISPVVPKKGCINCQDEMHQKTTRAYFFLRARVSGAPCTREHLGIGRWGVVGGGLEAIEQGIPPPPFVPKYFPSIVFGL